MLRYCRQIDNQLPQLAARPPVAFVVASRVAPEYLFRSVRKPQLWNLIVLSQLILASNGDFFFRIDINQAAMPFSGPNLCQTLNHLPGKPGIVIYANDVG
jgi:hypothetical protein